MRQKINGINHQIFIFFCGKECKDPQVLCIDIYASVLKDGGAFQPVSRSILADIFDSYFL